MDKLIDPQVREVIPLRVVESAPRSRAVSIGACSYCSYRSATHKGARWHCDVAGTSCWDARGDSGRCGPNAALHSAGPLDQF